MISPSYLLLTISLFSIILPVLGNPVSQKTSPNDWPPPSGNKMTNFPKASVAADVPECNKAGTDVLKEGGNAVDSLIATLMCIGVFKPHSSGLGGGCMMTIYNASLGKCQSIVAREMAPAAANTEMFVGRPGASFQGKESIATPGELHGLWTAYTHFGSGKIPWSRLLQPAIHYARNGFKIYNHYVHSINDPIVFDGLAKVSNDSRHLVYQPGTTTLLEEGKMLKLEKYADTLEAVANAKDPVELFYKGKIAQDIVKELGEKSHIRLEDLANFKTKIVEYPPTAFILDGLAVCGPPPPSSFVITQSIIQTMSEFYKNKTPDFNDPLYYHRLIEAEKFAYARRTELGDVDFVHHTRELLSNMTKREYSQKVVKMIKDTAQPVDYYRGMDQKPNHGTTHVCIIDQDGNAVSATSSINYTFGSMHIGNLTGIIYNDAMDDFSTPGVANYFGYAPSPTNFIKPGKRPMSSFSPMIVYNRGTKKVKMVVGSAGGSHIISGVAQVATRTLIFGQTVKEANDAPRLHNQFLPHVTECQDDFPKRIYDALTSLSGYKQVLVPYGDIFASVNILKVRDDGSIDGNCDFRREPGNAPDGF